QKPGLGRVQAVVPVVVPVDRKPVREAAGLEGGQRPDLAPAAAQIQAREGAREGRRHKWPRAGAGAHPVGAAAVVGRRAAAGEGAPHSSRNKSADSNPRVCTAYTLPASNS
ncbi:hypothetical protein, partial [Acidithiobacillus sp.]